MMFVPGYLERTLQFFKINVKDGLIKR